MGSTSRVKMAVVAMLGLVGGCLAAAVGRSVDDTAVDIPIVHAQATARSTAHAAPQSTTAVALTTASPSGRPMVAAALPPYPAQPTARKWQQYCVESYNHDLNMTLKQYGDAGWEYVDGDGYRTCFRRPAP